MTLRQINELFREGEIINEDDPKDRIVAILALMRSAHQKEIATNEGIAASLDKFIALFGEVTTQTVDSFISPFPGRLLDLEIPNEYILEVMKAD